MYHLMSLAIEYYQLMHVSVGQSTALSLMARYLLDRGDVDNSAGNMTPLPQSPSAETLPYSALLLLGLAPLKVGAPPLVTYMNPLAEASARTRYFASVADYVQVHDA